MAEWLAMGGYAVYVWGSFSAAAVVYAWMMWAPKAERRAILDNEENEE